MTDPPLHPPKFYDHNSDHIRPPSMLDILLSNVPPNTNLNNQPGSYCPHCCQELKNCHDVIFGNFCIYAVMDFVGLKKNQPTENEIVEAFTIAYLMSLQFVVYDNSRRYVMNFSMQLPMCIQISSLQRSIIYSKYQYESEKQNITTGAHHSLRNKFIIWAKDSNDGFEIIELI